MRPAHVLAAGAFLLASVAAWGAEPLVGVWRLDHQEVNGQEANSEPMTLKITQAGDKLAFAFSVPVNNIYFVSMSYTVKLDGTEADVKNAQGDKVGSIRITPGGPSQYKMILKSPNQPGQQRQAHRLAGRQDAHQRSGNTAGRAYPPFQANLLALLARAVPWASSRVSFAGRSKSRCAG